MRMRMRRKGGQKIDENWRSIKRIGRYKM